MTHIFSCKCMRCGLHFNVYSWSETWGEEYEAWCPECGAGSCFILNHRESPKEIFMFVPGMSNPDPS